MARHASKKAKVDARVPREIWWISLAGLALSWAFMATVLAGRRHLVKGYSTLTLGEPWMDPFFSSNGAFAVILCLAGVWLNAMLGQIESAKRRWACLWMGLTLLPLVLFAMRCSGISVGAVAYWEPLWFAGFSGLSFGCLALDSSRIPLRFSPRTEWMGVAVPVVLITLWWYFQSDWYYEQYLLGFNDFAHFSQRVANTAAGRGLLLESPVLPAFWDHFNPGLLLLVPLWMLIPNVHLIFVVQALCLGLSAIILWRIAWQMGYSSTERVLWAIAWLVQPALGQMNIAYTYGWHPISLAIPLLLLALKSFLQIRFLQCLAWLLLAGTMEEGVWVISACFCACVAGMAWLNRKQGAAMAESPRALAVSSETALDEAIRCFGFRNALLAMFGCGVIFLLIYRFSGIAEFQTGRFVALGASPVEILSSPVKNPQAFWGQLFAPVKAAYLLSLLLPLGLISLVRGWKVLLATGLPLLVLLVWDHVPATCLAFQYASVLLPVFWLAAMQGGWKGCSQADLGDRQAVNLAFGNAPLVACSTGLILSLYVGQLPVSSPSILGAIAATYGQQETPRSPATPVGKWLNEQVQRIHREGAEVLATSRVAAHLVGNRDIETVGQYLERRPKLAQLSDRKGKPIEHYHWIILDREESFQQSMQQTRQVLQEALDSGFRVDAEFEAIVVLKRPSQ